MEATIIVRGCGTLSWVDSNVIWGGHCVACRVGACSGNNYRVLGGDFKKKAISTKFLETI